MPAGNIPFSTQERTIRELSLDSFWKVKIYSYDDADNLEYLACNTVHSAETDAETWHIWKYTWDESANCTMSEGPLIGSVDGQESLAWRS